MSFVGSADNTGALRVNVVAGGGGGGGGNVVITNPLPLPVTVGNFPAVQPISGTVAVSNFPVTQAVSGTFFQATQPISGTVAVSNLANPMPVTIPTPVPVTDNGGSLTVDGNVSVSNFPATQPVSGTVTVSNFPATQPVSGTVTVSNPTTSATVGFKDSTTDAFSRLRVSTPQTLFNVQMQYDLCPQFMESGFTGTGTAPVLEAGEKVAILTGNAGNGSSWMQSYQYVPYQPGKSHLIVMTFVCGSAVADLDKRFGYFDSQNGFFFEQDGNGSLNMVRRSTANITSTTQDFKVFQPNWNIDRLDGTGPSGISLDVNWAQILIIDLQFLGMGRVRMGFDIDGIVYYAHEFRNANNNLLPRPYMQTATLPIQVFIGGTTSTGTASIKFKCAAVICEGNFDRRPDISQSTENVAATAGNGTRVHLFSIRPALLFAGVTNRVNFLPSQFNICVTGSNSVFYEIGVGATFSVAPTWAAINAGTSAFEIGTGGTLTTLPKVFETGYVSATNQTRGAMVSTFIFTNPIGLNRSGAHRNDGILTIAVTGIGGSSATRGSLDFEEYR